MVPDYPWDWNLALGRVDVDMYASTFQGVSNGLPYTTCGSPLSTP